MIKENVICRPLEKRGDAGPPDTRSIAPRLVGRGGGEDGRDPLEPRAMRDERTTADEREAE